MPSPLAVLVAGQRLSGSAPNAGLEVVERYRCPRDSQPVLPATLRGYTLVFRAELSIKTMPDSELFGDRTETLSASHDAPQAIHMSSDHHGIRSVASFCRGSSVHFFINKAYANRYSKISHSRVPLRLLLFSRSRYLGYLCHRDFHCFAQNLPPLLLRLEPLLLLGHSAAPEIRRTPRLSFLPP